MILAQLFLVLSAFIRISLLSENNRRHLRSLVRPTQKYEVSYYQGRARRCLEFCASAEIPAPPGGVTLFFLCFGLSLFGLGEALLIAAGAGAGPGTANWSQHWLVDISG